MSFPLGLRLMVQAGAQEAPTPLGPALTPFLTAAEVREAADGQGTFRLTFGAQREAGGLGPEVAVLADGRFAPGCRVVISVCDPLLPTPIGDGLVTNLWLDPGARPADARLVVDGADVTAAMDLEEAVASWPDEDEAIIVGRILEQYARFGLLPEIVPPPDSELPTVVQRTPVQRNTDLAYLYRLADRFGYVFWVSPGPALLSNTAYWGPERRPCLPAPALTVGDSTFANVDGLTFTLDGRAPFTVAGLGPGVAEADPALPIAAVEPILVPPLALRSPYPMSAMLGRRLPRGSDGLSELRAEAAAQGRINRAAARTARADGSLEVPRYGAILRAGGQVGVRGAGASFDGLWDVERVTHSITPRSYRQSFGLSREGTMPLAPVVRP